MKKSEKEPQIVEDSTPRLTPAEYWEWRCTISDMQKAETKVQLAVSESQVLRKDADLMTMKWQLHQKQQVQNSKDALQESKKEYDNMKKRLEDRLGLSLNGKMIDEYSYEVRDIPKEENKKE